MQLFGFGCVVASPSAIPGGGKAEGGFCGAYASMLLIILVC